MADCFNFSLYLFFLLYRFLRIKDLKYVLINLVTLYCASCINVHECIALLIGFCFLFIMQNIHKEEFKKYEAMKTLTPTKRPNSPPIEESKSSKKQCTFDMRRHRKQPSEEEVKGLIFNYIVEEMKPLRTVECTSFKSLCSGLCPNATVMSRPTLSQMVKTKYEEMVKVITCALSEVATVCTTVDLWSSQHRSFIGMTVHWLEQNTLKRMSAALACKRFQGCHTFDKIASAIHSIHAEYGIEYKVAKTCTDNGSNMVKAFNEFHVKLPVEDTTKTLKSTNNSSHDSSDVEEDYDESDSETVDASNFIEQSYLSSDCDEVALPPHMRCCTHTLNLVATTDASKASDDKQYKRIYHSSMSKASAIWNLTSRSTKAADAAFDIVGHRFQVLVIASLICYYLQLTYLVIYCNLLDVIIASVKYL